jgi:putative sugar O-methyltransferase
LYAQDEVAFSSFRRTGLGKILEGGSYEVGEIALKIMTRVGNLPKLKNYIDNARKNDSVGTPFIHQFGDLPPCSSSTLQYLGDSFEITNLIGATECKKITEIGGGFGGLCRIFDDFIKFDKYTLIDQPEALMLAKKYLGEFPEIMPRLQFISCFDTQQILLLPKQDLIIACSSLAELSSDIQDFYSDSLILNSYFTYVVYNTLHIKGSKQQLKKWLKFGRKIIQLR